MQVRMKKSGMFVEAGQVLDVPRVEADRLVREKRAELVPQRAGREEKMVPQRHPERMKPRR